MTATSVRDLTRGHYAVPICECGPPYECVGYKLYERKVARTYKNGRTVGRDRLVGPRLLCLEGIDRQRFDQALDDIGQLGRWSDPDIVQSEVELLAEFPIERQQEFGRFTGRCGCCGRRLNRPGLEDARHRPRMREARCRLMVALPSTARLPKVCPTCSADDTHRSLEHELSIWAHALTSPAWWCDACDRPWLRWCTWHPGWRGGPGPVTRHELEAA